MRVALDFDGTITERDELDVLAQDWSERTWHETEAMLAAGAISAAEALARELAPVRLRHDDAVALLVERARARPGLDALVAVARAHGAEVVVVSDGARAYATAFLRSLGLELPVDAHDVAFSETGTTVTPAAGGRCPACGHVCKRARLERMPRKTPLVYVGDGLSDRCAAAGADVVFARDALARHLAATGRPFHRFESLTDVAAHLSDHQVGAPPIHTNRP